MAQNGTDFSRMKPKQRKLAEALCDPENDKTVTAICNELGIPRRTYYNWLDNEDFNGYMKYLIDKYTSSELAAVWRALIKQAKNGKLEHIKCYFEMLGMMPGKGTGNSGDDDDDNETGVVLISEVKPRDE